MKVFYLDTSAAMKLLRHEVETPALVAWFHSIDQDRDRIVSSEILRTELALNATRYGASLEEVRGLLSSISLLSLSTSVLERAGQLSHLNLRSLVALHVASALELAPSLESMMTYDQKMVRATQQLGLAAVTPR